MMLEPSVAQAEIEAHKATLAGRRVAIIGAGRSGMACLRLLAGLGARVTLADAKPPNDLREQSQEAQSLGARVIVQFTQFGQLPEIDLLIVSPGVPGNHPAVAEACERQIEVIGELELAYCLFPSPIVAVTGTNGKGTCCRLLADMLRRGGLPNLLGGNIGLPLAAQMERATPKRVAVVEVSSFQLETIVHFRPRVAVLLNLEPDHLDRHGDLDEYIAAKARIFENQRAEDFAVANLDERIVARMARASPASLLGVSLSSDNAAGRLEGDMLVVALGGARRDICSARDFRLPGRHHITNVLAAALVARLFGVGPEQIAAAVRAYEPPPHHMELVAEIGGVSFINDSKATNPGAALADLTAVERPLIAIVGGKDKGADFSHLGRFLAQRPRHVILIGEGAKRIAAAMGEAARPEHADSLEAALDRAWRVAEAGDAVIMAPGCSSFDMFRDYAHRGEAFRRTVRSLARQQGVALPTDTPGEDAREG